MEVVLKTLCTLQQQQSHVVNDNGGRQVVVDSVMNLVTSMQARAEAIAVANSEKIQYTMRALQIAYWLLEQEVSYVSATTVATQFDTLIPFILASVQQPDMRLRTGAVSCLGLLCLLQPALFREHKGILYQAARVTDEDPAVRSAAIQCLTDLACVHKNLFEDDTSLCTILLRVQETEQSVLLPIAAESAAKLLFAGAISDPGLFANLLRFFFFSEEEDDDQTTTDAEGAEEKREAASRLQQILSIFFQAFIVSEGRCEQVALESVPQLVADMTSSVKFSGAKISSPHMVIKHLLTLCDNMHPAHRSSVDDTTSVATDMKDLIKSRATAAVCRELLKLGNSKIDKLLVKEYVRLLSTLNVDEWITANTKNTVRTVFQAVSDSVLLDKASQKIIANLITVCSMPSSGNIDNHHDEEGYFDSFMLSAPGLADLVAIASRTDTLGGDRDDDDSEVEVVAKKTKRSTSKDSNKATKNKKKESFKNDDDNGDSEGDEEEGNDEDEDEETDDDDETSVVEVTLPDTVTNSSRSGYSRSSKAVASKKIANQLAE